MFNTTRTVALATILMAASALAQNPSPPSGATGQCRDGTYWTGTTKQGACRGHKGIQTWYGSAGATATTPSSSTPAASTPAAPAAAPTAPSPAPAATPAKPATAPAPGGGPGMVWVNTSSHVYHCPSDRWYGKTKNGEYMSEADAVAKGNRPDHGKACK